MTRDKLKRHSRTSEQRSSQWQYVMTCNLHVVDPWIIGTYSWVACIDRWVRFDIETGHTSMFESLAVLCIFGAQKLPSALTRIRFGSKVWSWIGAVLFKAESLKSILKSDQRRSVLQISWPFQHWRLTLSEVKAHQLEITSSSMHDWKLTFSELNLVCSSTLARWVISLASFCTNQESGEIGEKNSASITTTNLSTLVAHSHARGANRCASWTMTPWQRQFWNQMRIQ